MRWSAAFIGVTVYLWVVHSAKAAIGTYGLLLGLIGIFVQAERLRVPPALLWFGAWVLWAAATTPMAVNPAVTWDATIDLAKLWLIFLVAANVAHSRRQLATLIVVWLGIYALYPVRGTFFNFIFGIQIFGRYAWNFIFANPNDLAALTLLILALAVATLQGEQRLKWIRYSALAGVIILPILIVITQSRGGILALGTFGLMVLVQYRREAKGLAITALAAGALYLVAPPDVWGRLAGLTSAGDPTTLREVDVEGSAEQRFEIWKVAVAIAKDHPVAGVGVGSYPAVHAEYASTGSFDLTARGQRDTHSIYLNTLAETGVIGLLLLLAMLASALWQGWRTVVRLRLTDPVASRQIATLVVGLVAFMQAGIFGSLHRIAFPYIYIGILVSAIAILGHGTIEGTPTRSGVAPSRRGAPPPTRRVS
ncbi:MAG: O-antigen ligase family protein [Gemmatimonadales bacterium]